MRAVIVYCCSGFEVVHISDFIYMDSPFAPPNTARDKLENQWLGSSVAAAKNGPIVVSIRVSCILEFVQS